MAGQDTAQWLYNGLYSTHQDFIRHVSTIDQRSLGDFVSFDFASILDLVKELPQMNILVRTIVSLRILGADYEKA